MAKDMEYQQLIHAGKWLRLRKLILTRTPLCQRCLAEGRTTAATEVHHIRPVEEAIAFNDKLQRMYDQTNLRALCHDCHVRTHTELGRSGRKATKKRNEKQVKQVIKRFFEGEEGNSKGILGEDRGADFLRQGHDF